MSADRLSPVRPAPMWAGAGIAGVAASSALLVLGQLWAARQLGILDPAQEWYVAGNDLWPFHLFLMAWYAASAAVVGLALIWPMVPGHQRWQVRIAATLAAVAGASAGLPLVRAWSAAAQGVTDPAGEATRLVVVGLLAAAAAAAVSTALPAVRRGLVGWQRTSRRLSAETILAHRDADRAMAMVVDSGLIAAALVDSGPVDVANVLRRATMVVRYQPTPPRRHTRTC